jgi:hypothetical protein
MPNCYLCNKEITKSNRSKEHIIPNAIGGKLSSFNIWCSSCIDYYGTIDTRVTEPLKPIVSLLDIFRDRGKNQSFSATGIDGTKLIVEPKGGAYIRHAKVKEKNHGDKTELNISVGGRTHSERLKNLERVLKGKQRKYPQITDELISEFLDKARSEKAFPEDDLMKCPTIVFSGTDGFQALTKIALHIYIFHYGKPVNSDDIVKYIKTGESEYERIWFSFDYSPFIESEIVSNSYVLIGDKRERILWAYIDLLSIYPVVVILNNNYQGPNLTKSYEHNVIDNTESEPTIVKKIDRKALFDMFEKKDRPYKIMQARINRVVEYYYRSNNMPLEKSKFT